MWGSIKQAMRLQDNREILHMPRPVRVGTLFLFAVLSFVCLYGQVAFAASNVVVSPAHLHEWQSEPGTSGLPASFIVDMSAPLFRGALRLQTADDLTTAGQSKVRFVTTLHDLALSSVLVSGAGYYTKQNNITSPSSLPSYQIDVQSSDQTTSTTLIYEPYLSNAEITIRADEWQRWDVSGGTFRSTQTIGSLTTTGRYTLAEISAALPGVTVLRVGVGIESGSSASQSDVDAFVFNETTYDFEPDVPVPAIPQNLQLYGTADQAIACGLTTNSETIGLQWDAVAGDVVRYEYEVLLSGGTPSLINAGFQTTATVPIVSDGQWLLRVRAVNSAGVASNWSSECSISVDRTAPVLTVRVGSDSSATSRIISGTTDDVDSLITVVVNEVSYVVPSGLTGNWALALDRLGVGIYDIEVTSVDAMGNATALSAHFTVEMPIQVTASDAQLDEAIDALSQPFSLPQPISASLNSTVQQPRITSSDIEAIESQIKHNSISSNGSDITSKGVIAAQSDEGWQLFGVAWYWWVLSVLGGAVGVWYFKPTRTT